MKTKEKRLTFEIPEGLDIGDKKESDTIEAVAEFEIKKGGKLCLKSVNGIELSEYAEKETPSDEEAASIGATVMGGMPS